MLGSAAVRCGRPLAESMKATLSGPADAASVRKHLDAYDWSQFVVPAEGAKGSYEARPSLGACSREGTSPIGKYVEDVRCLWSFFCSAVCRRTSVRFLTCSFFSSFGRDENILHYSWGLRFFR